MKEHIVKINDKPEEGQIIYTWLYGSRTQVRILKVHPMGTLDVERLLDGECFRVTGLSF